MATDETDNAEIMQRIEALEARVNEMHNEITAIGRWLKALADNDVRVMTFSTVTLAELFAKRKDGKSSELSTFILEFRDDIHRKIVTEDDE